MMLRLLLLRSHFGAALYIKNSHSQYLLTRHHTLAQSYIMALQKILCSLALISSLSTVIAKECSPAAGGNETADDSPTINNAIRECGQNGTIILSSPQGYFLRTPIDLSPCNHCDVQIESLLKVGPGQPRFWIDTGHLIYIANTTGVRLRSVMGHGAIDGNGEEWFNRTEWVTIPNVALTQNANQSSLYSRSHHNGTALLSSKSPTKPAT